MECIKLRWIHKSENAFNKLQLIKKINNRDTYHCKKK